MLSGFMAISWRPAPREEICITFGQINVRSAPDTIDALRGGRQG
jgi:hypothetical protein